MSWKKLPLIRKIFDKVNSLKAEIEDLKKQVVEASTIAIDNRLKSKKLAGEKINVVFICNRPSVWGSLKSVYETLRADNSFNVNVLAIPSKNFAQKEESYYSEGAEEFFKSYDAINGYDYEKKEWFNLNDLSPDYIFVQQPYNVNKCDKYNSFELAKQAKICYVSYFGVYSNDFILPETNPLDFLDDVSFYFTQNKYDSEFIGQIKKEKELSLTFLETGFPRFDELKSYKIKSQGVWKSENGEFRILWTPRWTTNEGNCGFFDFKEKFFNLCTENKDIEFVLRPHPQMFKEFETTKELTREQAEEYKARFNNFDNAVLDQTGDYKDTMFASSCMISDKSSMVIDYLFTGKPIIMYKKGFEFEGLLGDLSKGFYIAKTWEDVEKTLNELKEGKDPLKEVRESLIKEVLNVGEDLVGEKIKEIIKADALK